MIRFKNLILFLILGITLIGCGYSTHSLAMKNHKTIYIEPFVNKIDLTNENSEYRKLVTYYPVLEIKITQGVTDRFIFDGTFKVAKKEDADLVLRGELLGYTRDALRYKDNEEVQEYRLTLMVNLSLWEKGKNEPLWQEANFKGDATYFTSGSNARTEEQAIADLITDFSRRVIERIVEPW